MSRRVVDFPDGWGTGAPVDEVAFVNGDMRIFGLLLDDGSNLFALIYPGGQRFVRAAAQADYALEEAFTGDPPSAGDLPAVDAQWRQILSMMIEAGRKTDAALEANGLPTRRPRP